MKFSSSTGLSGSVMSMIRKPSYVPWYAFFPQKVRSELKTPEPATEKGTTRGE